MPSITLKKKMLNEEKIIYGLFDIRSTIFQWIMRRHLR
jgi:hypothetical protein